VCRPVVTLATGEPDLNDTPKGRKVARRN
jgi:hypothetical protein